MCIIFRINTDIDWYNSRNGKPIVPVIALCVGMLCKIVISYTLTGIPDINVLGSAFGTVTAYFVAAMINLLYVKNT